jgi:hypothetical protein
MRDAMTRRGSIFLAATANLAALASMAPARATESTVGYNLAAGACRVIALPVSNKPVLVTGAQVSPGNWGVGQATILRSPGTEPVMFWAGVDYRVGLEQSGSSGTPTHIIWLDYHAYVDVQSAPNLQIQVCNSASNTMFSPAKGYVTFVY